jgi:hypothetical protein
MILQRDFSTVSEEDLKMAGVMRKQLIFDPVKVTKLTKGLTTSAEAEIVGLHAQIKKIYVHVNMDVRLVLITFWLFEMTQNTCF